MEVTVKTGDYLERIARINGTTVKEVMRINGLENHNLKVGQVLKVPVMVAQKIEKKEQGMELAEDNGKIYIVKSGDNPWLIAIRHRIPLEDLLKLNDLDEETARKLKPGDKLRVR